MAPISSNQPSPGFPGFDLPKQNWFKMPHYWTDITAEMSSIAELKVVEYVLKHTWGYQEYGVRKRITNEEFMNGRRRKDGTRIDNGTGLSKPSVISGLRSAVERGLLIEEIDDSDKARVKKYYSLRMLPDRDNEFGDNEFGQDDNPPDTGEPMSANEGKEGNEGGVKDLNAGVKDFNPGVKNFYPRGKESLPRTEKETIERNLEKEENNNNSGDGFQEQTDVVVALVRHGISEKTARRLAGRHTPARVLEKIDFLNYLKEHDPERVKNPQGWLRKAIEDDYAAPDGYQSPAARAAEEAAQRQHDEAIARAAEEAERRLEAQAARDRQELAQKQQAEAARLAALCSRYGTTAREGEIWQQVLDELKFQLPDAVFQSYLATSELLTVRNARDGAAVVMLRDGWTRDWVANRLSVKIQRLLAQHVEGGEVTLQFIAFEQPSNGAGG